MTSSVIRRKAAVLLFAFTGASCAGASRHAMQVAPQPAPLEGHAAGVAQARADSLRHPYTEADINFMSGMIGHHSQAIAMARWAPTHGASPAVQRLASRIINAQKDEIRIMQQWLGDRNQAVPAQDTTGRGMMMMDGQMHQMLMPGMLTDAQMDTLNAARGPDFDRRFLIFMIQHHSGAISMVTDLFGSYGAAQDELTFKLASDINVDQTTEVARMQRLLASITLGIPLS